jgi:hypothetical protein
VSTAVFETADRRLYSPAAVFGGRYRHGCMAACGNEMIVPAPDSAKTRLEDGDIWRCNTCGALHEYYVVRLPGTRHAAVRLLRGVHRREAGEPLLTEFVEDV